MIGSLEFLDNLFKIAGIDFDKLDFSKQVELSYYVQDIFQEIKVTARHDGYVTGFHDYPNRDRW